MPKVLKVIFLESHDDPVCTTLKVLLPELISFGFKNYYDEQGSNHNIDSVIKRYNDNIDTIQAELALPYSREEAPVRALARQTLKQNMDTVNFLKQAMSASIYYKCVDIPHIENQYFIEEPNEQEIEILNALTLKRTQVMLQAYLAAQEHTFGVMGYTHGPQAIQELAKMNDAEQEFLFIYPYSQLMDEDDDEFQFIEEVTKGSLAIPIHCFDLSTTNKRQTNCASILSLIQQLIAKNGMSAREETSSTGATITSDVRTLARGLNNLLVSGRPKSREANPESHVGVANIR